MADIGTPDKWWDEPAEDPWEIPIPAEPVTTPAPQREPVPA
ncbi:hypothetical protein [Parafrankia sp. FMc2]